VQRFRILGLAFILLSVVALDRASAERRCPPPKKDEPCPRVFAFARNPGNSTFCCFYSSPCVAPEGWETFLTLEQCQTARTK
jgi:hypothetical protein